MLQKNFSFAIHLVLHVDPEFCKVCFYDILVVELVVDLPQKVVFSIFEAFLRKKFEKF